MTENPTPAPTGFINWLCDGIAHACLVIAALSLLCIVAINGANVVARYFFGSPFSWAEELMLFLMILGVFTGAVAVTWRNLHIRIDTLVDRLPPRLRRVVSVIATLASVAILTIVMVASFRLVSLLQSMEQVQRRAACAELDPAVLRHHRPRFDGADDAGEACRLVPSLNSRQHR